jgi:hypothetical protein
LDQYEQKDKRIEDELLNGKKKAAVTLPYQEAANYQHRKDLMNKALTDEETFQRKLNSAIKKKRHE